MDQLSEDTLVTIVAMVSGTVLLLGGMTLGQGLITFALGAHFGRAV
jgi:hypothetical protein